MSEYNHLFLNLDSLKDKINKLPKNQKIVYTYGAWDLYHPGHVNLLRRVKKLGDFLIVGVLADRPIRDLKGKDRPTQSQEERLIVISSSRYVDAAISQPEYDPSQQLRQIQRIDILTKGDDWDYIPGTETIEELGGKLVKLSYTQGFSTSMLVKKLGKQK